MRDIWSEFRRMQREFDRLFNSLLDYDYHLEDKYPEERYLTYQNYERPLADIYEDEKNFIATVEIPGVNKEDIQVNITDDNKLEIKVERKDEVKKEDKKKGYYRLERRYAGYYRVIPLPDYVDKDNIKASYKNGVLELIIPKKQIEDKSKKKIKIE